MGRASIPVDLHNPGQVFACLGFLEAAHTLLGNAEGGFAWADEAQPRFDLNAGGPGNPVEVVTEFVCKARIERLVPAGYADPTDEKVRVVDWFPGPQADEKTLPVRLTGAARAVDVTLWCDGSSRTSFKLFAGTQRAHDIACEMIDSIRVLWERCRQALVRDPLGVTMPLGGGSFKLDARKWWTGIAAGYSPNDQGHDVEASPMVEMLGAIGLEHARPNEFETREVRYGVWKGLLPPILARPALGGVRVGVPMRVFRFSLDLAGKNKVVTFAREETQP